MKILSTILGVYKMIVALRNERFLQKIHKGFNHYINTFALINQNQQFNVDFTSACNKLTLNVAFKKTITSINQLDTYQHNFGINPNHIVV